MNRVIDVMNDEQPEDENVCLKCGAHLDILDYRWTYVNHHYGDTVESEAISTGYTCPNCGHKEEF